VQFLIGTTLMGAYMPLESSSLPIGTLVPPYHCKIDSILTTDTKAQVWDNCIPGRQDEILDDAALRRRLASYTLFWKNNGEGVRLKDPKFVLV
jgi:hypothetical protein